MNSDNHILKVRPASRVRLDLFLRNFLGQCNQAIMRPANYPSFGEDVLFTQADLVVNIPISRAEWSELKKFLDFTLDLQKFEFLQAEDLDKLRIIGKESFSEIMKGKEIKTYLQP